MDWVGLAFASLTGIAVLGVVGLVLSWALGLRGFWAIAVAPAFAVTVTAGTAVIAGFVGFGWSILPVIVMTLVLAAILRGARYLVERRFGAPAPAERRRFDGWLLTGVILAALIITVRFAQIIGDPGNISQTFDNIFHLNAVRFMLETGNASSLGIGQMTNPGGSLGFYPAAWHANVALIVQLSGVSTPVAVNAFTLVISAVIWPLGILLLTRSLFAAARARLDARVLVLFAGLLAASLPTFPFLLMDYGVLYPYQLGLALVPTALAVTLAALGLDRSSTVGVARVWWVIALLGILPGLAIAHPTAFVSWLALSLPMAIVFAVQRWRASTSVGGRVLVVVLFLAYGGVGFVALRVLRPPGEARGWPPVTTIADAAQQVLLGSTWYAIPAVLAAILVIVGIVWAFIVRTPGAIVAVGMYLVAAYLFINVAALSIPSLRDLFTGTWYNNIPRLAALLPIVMVPLGAFSIACTAKWLADRAAVRRALDSSPRWAKALVGGVVVVGAVAALQAGPVPRAVEWASRVFAVTPDSALLSTDEFALLDRLDEHVPEGVAIAGSPWTGSSLAFAITGRPVLMPHTLMEISDDLELINDELGEATPGSAVCSAVDDLDVGFVLDFGGREVHPGEHLYPGLTDLERSDSVRLVDEQGDARLFEIVACG